MAWVVGANVLMGLLLIALGLVTLRTGWILPTARRHVTRPQLHGLGTLLTGTSLVFQGLFYFRILPSVSWEIRLFGGNAFLFAGLFLIIAGQLLAHRRSPHPDPHRSLRSFRSIASRMSPREDGAGVDRPGPADDA
ncbi:hypothetical protein [Streptomyces sp. NBC_01240]|uniref:hypothetical protein n=1 Tax=Streptomyces sp. NBC_01240 TaxID=2903793 RepID=UPI002E1219CE|nr:hypothetical protein OG466_14965 [Streptomyces sp. NBC_01240]